MAALLLAGCAPAPAGPPSASPRGDDAPVVRQGRPVDVIDGDTFDLADGTRVRLAIVDTPEVRGGAEPCGPEASDFTGRFLAGSTVAVYRPTDAPDEGGFGRLLGEVVRVTDGASLNVALVAAGLGRIDERYTDEDPDLTTRLRSAAAGATVPDCAASAASAVAGSGPVSITAVRHDAPGDDDRASDRWFAGMGQGYLNNSGGDVVRLVDPTGTTVSTFSYDS